MANGANGIFPPPGASPIVDPYGIPLAPSGREVTTDPAFQAPSRSTLDDTGKLKARAFRISREIPNVLTQTGWTVSAIRSSLIDHAAGIWDSPAQLHDALSGDSRIQSAMRSLSGGLLGKEIQFRLPKGLEDDPTAKKCLRLWTRHWPEMHAEPALLDLLETAPSLGFAFAQILWDTGGKYWMPYLQAFNARYSYFHWLLRAHIAVTQDGQERIDGGDGHWVLFAPYGVYRGWMRGGIRALAQWYLARAYALRDWARYCERHGFPMLLADTPFGADPTSISNFQSQLSGTGQETILQLPGAVEPQKYGKYDLRYLEPEDQGWQAFKELIAQCNTEITLALMGQNLTSEVKEGSFAAARVHADVRQAILELFARAMCRTLFVQLLRPFAALNVGDARYAPRPLWKIQPAEDKRMLAQTFQSFGTGLNQMRMAGYRVKDVVKMGRGFGLKITEVEHVDPIQVEAKLAGTTGEAQEQAQGIDGGGDDGSEEREGEERDPERDSEENQS